ncbi:phosphoribosyltransferase family protein [Chishuiella sp.]|uniref:phosphoribosyltransferase family protein n=1 Tax=Chishuiella sp. TaxID=1969467 RepID=UPI0028A5EA04|nr:phosphoribosyltransferase family protein [Chishuiella sp.]
MEVQNFNYTLFDNFLTTKISDFIDNNTTCLVIGIKEGGMPLAEMVVEKLQTYTSQKVDLIGVLCQRSSTKNKRNKRNKIILEKSLNLLPESLLNKLRIIEHSFLINKRDLHREVHIPEDIDYTKYNKILIVDDAVDSGATLKKVLDGVNKNINSEVDITTLSVVVTDTKASIIPDYYLYSDVLIRFPWSIDGQKSNF